VTTPDTETTPAGVREDIASTGVPVFGSSFMLVCQVALGVLFLLLWQGASGRLVDSFFISDPVRSFCTSGRPFTPRF
jgi:hypothetical protein